MTILQPARVDRVRASVLQSPLLPLLADRPATQRPAQVGAQDWVAAVEASVLPSAVSTDRLLVGIRAGLAAEDVAVLFDWPHPIENDPAGFHISRGAHAGGLWRTLTFLAHRLPGLSLRAAVGWLLLNRRDYPDEREAGGTPPALATWVTGDRSVWGALMLAHLTSAANADSADDSVIEAQAVGPALAGLAECGWHLAAAGVSRAEAETLTVTGELDWGRLEALAALRGFRRPVTE